MQYKIVSVIFTCFCPSIIEFQIRISLRNHFWWQSLGAYRQIDSDDGEQLLNIINVIQIHNCQAIDRL